MRNALENGYETVGAIAINPEIIGKDMNDLISKLPTCNDLPLSDALLPLCYKHVDGLWDICDIVILIVCLTNMV